MIVGGKHLEGRHCGFLCKCRFFTNTSRLARAIAPKKLNLSSTKCQIYFIFSKTALKYEWESEDENGTMSDWAGSTLAGGTPNYYALHLLYQHVHANLDLSSQDANVGTYQHIFSYIFTCYKYLQCTFNVKQNWVVGINLKSKRLSKPVLDILRNLRNAVSQNLLYCRVVGAGG